MGQDEGRSSRELIEQQKRNGRNFLLRLDIHWVGATKFGEPRGVANLSVLFASFPTVLSTKCPVMRPSSFCRGQTPCIVESSRHAVGILTTSAVLDQD